MKRYFYYIIIMLFQCKNSSSKENVLIKRIDVDTKHIADNDEICYEIGGPFKYNRNIKIIENTLSDTIIITGIIPPKFKGNIYYSKFVNMEGKTIQLDERYQNPKLTIEKICISKYKDLDSKGQIIIEFTHTIQK